jgi:hypothetical protein
VDGSITTVCKNLVDANSGWTLSGGAVSASSFEATSFTGSLLGTASWANNAISSSYALNATNAVSSSYSVSSSYANVSTSASYAANAGLFTGKDVTTFATTGSNTFTSNQIISGSVTNKVNTVTVTSQTASIDLSTGNLFTLTLVNGASTHISASNIQRGQTTSLQITNGTLGTGTVTFSSAFTFPSGSSYVPFASSSAVDLISFISFDNTKLRAVTQNNFI